MWGVLSVKIYGFFIRALSASNLSLKSTVFKGILTIGQTTRTLSNPAADLLNRQTVCFRFHTVFCSIELQLKRQYSYSTGSVEESNESMKLKLPGIVSTTEIPSAVVKEAAGALPLPYTWNKFLMTERERSGVVLAERKNGS